MKTDKFLDIIAGLVALIAIIHSLAIWLNIWYWPELDTYIGIAFFISLLWGYRKFLKWLLNLLIIPILLCFLPPTAAAIIAAGMFIAGAIIMDNNKKTPINDPEIQY